MAGIDNIANEILQEAKDKAASLIAEATKKAAEQIAEAKKQGEEIAAKSAEKAAQDTKSYGDRIDSQISLRKRQAVLTAKQDIIAQVIEAAGKKLSAQSDTDYFAMIGSLLKNHVRAGSGEILFSEKDAKRLPEGFTEVVEKAAQAAGGSLTVSKETADIDDGFILRYGGIEENCTLKALFAEKRDALSDKVAEALWHEEKHE